MKKKVLDFIINNIRKYQNYSETKLIEIRYGLESIYLSIFKIIVLLIISFFIHTAKELCVFYFTFGLLRLTGFGLHARNSIQCWILSIITFSLIPFLIKSIEIKNILLIIISILNLFIICIYAPADTEKRPLINKQKRIIYKIITISIGIIYLVLIICLKSFYYKQLFFFSILLESILILPISYKFLGLKYANYKDYRGKEGKK